MNLINTNIKDLLLKELTQIKDSRGDILHMIKSSDKIFKKFGEIYFSEIKPGEIKAWKLHNLQTQNITVPSGRVLFIVYDDRINSPTYKNIFKIEIGRPDSYLLLTIPPGLWYGFKSKCTHSAIVANFTEIPHDINESKKKAINENLCDINWNLV